jgi:hypothetical protein
MATTAAEETEPQSSDDVIAQLCLSKLVQVSTGCCSTLTLGAANFLNARLSKTLVTRRQSSISRSHASQL